MGTTDYTPPPAPQWVDLTGLPDEFVRSVRQAVAEARERHAAPVPNGSHPPTGPVPEELAAEVERIQREYAEGRVTPRVRYATNPRLTNEEFRKLLDEMAALGMGDAPPLPADWSRADIYEDE